MFVSNSNNKSKPNYIAIVWCMLEILCFGGLQFGWASLAYILKKEKFFLDGCEVNSHEEESIEGGCDYQETKLSFMFTVSSGLQIVPLLLCGLCMSLFGLAKTRIIYTFVFVAGCAMAILSSSENPWLMSAALALLSGGGRIYFLSSLQRASHFGTDSFLVLAAMNGCYDSSAAVMLLVKIAYDSGIGRRLSFGFIMAASTTTLLNTYFNFVTREDEGESEIIPKEILGKQGRTRHIHVPKALKNYKCDVVLISHIAWFCMMVSHVMFAFSSSHIYIQTVVEQVHDTDVSSLTNFQSIALTAGIVPALFAGIYLEVFKLKLTGSEYSRNMKTFIIGVFTINLLSMTMAILPLFSVLPIVYANFCVLPVLRSFLFSLAYTFVVKMLPESSIGITSSILDVLACVLLFFQKTFVLWLQAYENAAVHIGITFAVISFIAMFHPIVLWISMRKTNMEGPADLGSHFGAANGVHTEKQTATPNRNNAKIAIISDFSQCHHSLTALK